ncbi:SRPBCC domain-containing protein [Flavobacterium sp. MAH-1]|uniref:SRPBCC domain-containing protein n=1 Tax=Flavobacterium agri TaxID=2743471 RepID=A0A7Y8Y471_9FLAO|nr:SRPBCC domain-containing protein [Flavobacterium agri]NUY81554.1 SRPBCC domain-containing protein [Flavobacterium agri]NYA71578.1 SRPBCC domain-containing protein [Flavobacterium agri]
MSQLEIVSRREFAHPINKLWRAWTNPEHLKVWWGPNGFTNTIHKHDLRVGGTWRLTMHGPEKGNYENEARFTVVEPEKRLEWDRVSQPLFYVTVVFDKIDEDKTSVTFKMKFYEQKMYDTIVKFAPEKNEENFDRLESELEKM